MVNRGPDYILPSDPAFNTSMASLTVDTPAHADEFNPMFEQLLCNDQFVREELLKHFHDDRYYTESKMNTMLARKSDTGHTHSAAQVGAAAASHTHDDRYYTESEINTKMGTKSDTGHTHTAAQVGAATAGHTHTAAQVGAAATSHTHASVNYASYAGVTSLVTPTTNFGTIGEVRISYTEFNTLKIIHGYFYIASKLTGNGKAEMYMPGVGLGGTGLGQVYFYNSPLMALGIKVGNNGVIQFYKLDGTGYISISDIGRGYTSIFIIQ